MTLMRFDPFRDLERFNETLTGAGRGFRPMPMEAFRRGDEIVAAIDIPGVDPGDVDVTVERNVVSIKARRNRLRNEGDEVLIDERAHGEFSRQLFLGDNLDSKKLKANIDLGVLTLTVPVSEHSKPRRVDVAAERTEPRTIEAESNQSNRQSTNA